MNKKKSGVLRDRILLKEEVGEHFIENVEMRYKVAVRLMNIDVSNLSRIYCSSINKHTCSASDGEINYIIFDEHQMEVLSALNILYYLYGQIDLKMGIFDFILSREDYFKERLKNTIIIILAEKQILQGNMENALYYAEKIHEDAPSLDRNKKGFWELFTLKQWKSYIAYAFCLDFYVFHEMAHIKYSQQICEFDNMRNLYDSLLSNLSPLFELLLQEEKYEVTLNVQECLCDTYALLKLLEYMETELENEELGANRGYLIEGYIISVVNIVIMNSIYQNENLDKKYINAYLRIILVINMVGVLYEASDKKNILEDFQDEMQWVGKRFSNYKRHFDSTWNSIVLENDNDIQRVEFMSKEWYRNYEEVIKILSKIK